MRRSYDLLRRVTDQSGGPEELRQMEHARDVLFHFCCDVLHLRDWIHSSISDQSIREHAKKLFRDDQNAASVSTALAACADIANASKHRELDGWSYTARQYAGGYATVVSHTKGLKIPFTLPGSLDTNHWTISAGGQEYEAVDLAVRAIADWDAWLTQVGLLPLHHDP